MPITELLERNARECPDEIFDLLEFRSRINCVVFEDAKDPATKEKLIAFRNNPGDESWIGGKR